MKQAASPRPYWLYRYLFNPRLSIRENPFGLSPSTSSGQAKLWVNGFQ